MNIKDLRVGTPVIYHGHRKFLTHILGFEENAFDIICARILLNGERVLVKFSDISLADFQIPDNPILEEIFQEQKYFREQYHQEPSSL